MKNFIMNITTLIKEKLGDGYNVSTKEVTKNNGVVLQGLLICKEHENITPTIYLENFFKSHMEGTPLDYIADKIIKIYQQEKPTFAFEPESFTDFNRVKDNIIFTLINTEKNQSILQDIANIPFLDLSIIFRVYLQIPQCENAFITIQKSHLKIWGITLQELYAIALENTPKLLPAQIQNMKDILSHMFPVDYEENSSDMMPMYVLSNQKLLVGCGCILYPYLLENFANIIHEDLYILPSSTHEVILLPASNIIDKSNLSEMVKEVNINEVAEEEILSDNVYYFSRESKKIALVE